MHGEFERNDMVEFFGENLSGYVFTIGGWVQSYGTRGVKPPIVFGDVKRKKSITTDYIRYANSLTDKDVKGMLTGPVTILNWSFPREDISTQEMMYQIGLAIREEVLELEAAGVRIIQIDEAVLVITAAVSLSSISEQFSNAFSDLMKSGTFVTDFRTCVNLSLKKEAENQNKPFLSENKSRMEIVFDHVSFRYPGKEQYILQDFSLKIHAGEKIAIVGLNGSGKTTLVKLLCRFYIPDEGQILLNGRNIYEYNEEEYNSFISAVFQDYKLFSFSLKDNILLGKTENPEDINIALKKSGFSQRLKTLDNGLDTLYSKEFDKNGVELSGGESQKLAIARACYKDAPIIILDEPTASLDAVAEYEIYAGFEKLVENKTAIIISHRLSSTHFCDRIIVINNGTVFEDGTHQSLMAKESGIYKKMFTTQAAHYFSDPTTVAVVD